MADIRKQDDGMWAADVDGKTYAFSKFNAEEGLDVLMDIGTVIGTPLSVAFAAMNEGRNEGLKTEITGELAEQVVGGLAKNLRSDKALVLGIIKKLTSGDGVLCNGRPFTFNDHYADDFVHMFKVVRAGFEVQFSNFFAGKGKGGLLSP